MTKYAFYFDAGGCSGCNACQVACRDKHILRSDVSWRRVYEISGGGWLQERNAWKPDVFAYHLSIACNHCEKPICAEVCPVGAFTKREDGIVTLDSERCIGCGYCSWACPYDALSYQEISGSVTKCTFCADEIDRGKAPTCVRACPMRVLDFGSFEELEKKHKRGAGTGFPYPMPQGQFTNPSLIVAPHKDSHRGQNEPSRTKSSVKVNLKEKPLIWFTLLSQIAVGMFLALMLLHGVVRNMTFEGIANRLTDFAWLTIGPVILMGLLYSSRHLGKPEFAYRAISNLKTSWLSREVLFTILFASSGAFFSGMQWFKLGPDIFRWGIGWITVVFGITLIYCMARVYMIRTIPSWNTLITPISFFSAALILGGLAAIVSIITDVSIQSAIGAGGDILRHEFYGFMRVFAVGIVFVTGLEIILSRLQMAYLKTAIITTRSKRKISKKINRLVWVRGGLLLLGGILVGFFFSNSIYATDNQFLFNLLVLVVFLIYLAAEIMGRVLFYRSFVRYGL